VVWAWDLLLCGFFAAVSRPLLATIFRSAICDCLSLNVSILTSTPVRIHEDIIISAESLQPRADAMVGDFEIYK
jgi:hypothetical protein